MTWHVKSKSQLWLSKFCHKRWVQTTKLENVLQELIWMAKTPRLLANKGFAVAAEQQWTFETMQLVIPYISNMTLYDNRDLKKAIFELGMCLTYSSLANKWSLFFATFCSTSSLLYLLQCHFMWTLVSDPFCFHVLELPNFLSYLKSASPNSKCV